jgi:hypothetical protein
MTVPSLAYGFLVASLYGALFHFLRGGGLPRLFLYLVLAWLGFGAGQLLAIWRGWLLLPVGSLDLGLGSLGSWLFLFVGNWLSLVEIRARDRDDGV